MADPGAAGDVRRAWSRRVLRAWIAARGMPEPVCWLEVRVSIWTFLNRDAVLLQYRRINIIITLGKIKIVKYSVQKKSIAKGAHFGRCCTNARRAEGGMPLRATYLRWVEILSITRRLERHAVANVSGVWWRSVVRVEGLPIVKNQKNIHD